VPRPTGNVRLKAARVAAGYNSQQDLADALTRNAKQLGIRGLSIGVRQVRRWESENPPWPQPDCQRVLVHLLGQSMEALGFTPPWGSDGPRPNQTRRTLVAGGAAALGLAAVPGQSVAAPQPATVGVDFEAVARSHRRLYWTVAPTKLHPAVVAHATLGCALLPETTAATRRTVSPAGSSSSTSANRAWRMTPSSSPCRPQARPTTHCSDQRSSRT
jgi:hypothetical protein